MQRVTQLCASCATTLNVNTRPQREQCVWWIMGQHSSPCSSVSQSHGDAPWGPFGMSMPCNASSATKQWLEASLWQIGIPKAWAHKVILSSGKSYSMWSLQLPVTVSEEKKLCVIPQWILNEHWLTFQLNHVICIFSWEVGLDLHSWYLSFQSQIRF